jgi:hypothetical protein
MPSYQPPQLPLVAAVYYEENSIPPANDASDLLEISLSPLRPEDFLLMSTLRLALTPTHIIRCRTNLFLGDNFNPDAPSVLFPCTVFEFPTDSQHWYVCTWAHIIGTGFPNEHSRCYVTRITPSDLAQLPLYVGWH